MQSRDSFPPLLLASISKQRTKRAMYCFLSVATVAGGAMLCTSSEADPSWLC